MTDPSQCRTYRLSACVLAFVAQWLTPVGLCGRSLSVPSHHRYLNIVDLAGSERVSKTGASGKRLKEGGSINQSLLALSNVIKSLIKRSKHIPYRNSKLTRLLTSSLGGNARTAMVACISPARWNKEESLSTLRFASSAIQVVNSVSVNTLEAAETLSARYEKELAELREKMASGQGVTLTLADGRTVTGQDIQVCGWACARAL